MIIPNIRAICSINNILVSLNSNIQIFNLTSHIFVTEAKGHMAERHYELCILGWRGRKRGTKNDGKLIIKKQRKRGYTKYICVALKP